MEIIIQFVKKMLGEISEIYQEIEKGKVIEMINLKEYKNRQEIISLLADCIYSDEERVKREYEQYNSDQTRTLFGRIKNNELVAIIGVIWLSEYAVELKHISVKSSNRRQGLGKEMINEFIEEKHIKRLEAETDKNAVSFYKKIGFNITSLGEKYPGVERFKCIKDCY